MPRDVIMPALGMAQDTGRIVAWLKAPGDAVAEGDPLFEVETDKAVMEVPASTAGYLSGVLASVDEDVVVGSVIAQIVETADAVTATVSPAKKAVVSNPALAQKASSSVTNGAIARPGPGTPLTGRVLASPKARRLAAERGIDLDLLRAQGLPEPFHADDLDHVGEASVAEAMASPSVRRLAANRGINLGQLANLLGRTTIAREDVLGETQTRAVKPTFPSPWDVEHAAYGPVTEEPMSRMALLSAANLLAATASIPQVTHHDCADVSHLEKLREDLKAKGQKVTALAFHVAALARCLTEFPRFNASLTSDGKVLILKGYVHIGIAVDTEHGLMIPVIRNAGQLTITQIGSAIADLSNRARARKIRPEEMGGASMSISNLGALGGEAFTPIVNPPELAILGLSRTEIRPVWDGATFVPTPMVPIDLSYDHRVINGADAARFQTRYRGLISAAHEWAQID